MRAEGAARPSPQAHARRRRRQAIGKSRGPQAGGACGGAAARRPQQQDDLSVFTLRPSPGRTVAPPARDAIGWLAMRCLIAAGIV